MAKSVFGQPEQLPDGTTRVMILDSDTGTVEQQIIGTPRNPTDIGRESGQAAAAKFEGMYSDPWYVENFLRPQNEAIARQGQDRATQLQNQAKQLEIQGRTAEANILYQQAQVELRKQELKQSNEQFYSGQQLQANLALGQMTGPGNYASFIDSGRRLNSMGIQTGALAQIAAGGTATGAFAPGASMKPISMADRMSGMLGASSQDQIDQRDKNDQALANQISAGAGQLARGSLESLSPTERDYLGGYVNKGGNDWNATQDAYKRAAIMQGRRS